MPVPFTKTVCETKHRALRGVCQGGERPACGPLGNFPVRSKQNTVSPNYALLVALSCVQVSFKRRCWGVPWVLHVFKTGALCPLL